MLANPSTHPHNEYIETKNNKENKEQHRKEEEKEKKDEESISAVSDFFFFFSFFSFFLSSFFLPLPPCFACTVASQQYHVRERGRQSDQDVGGGRRVRGLPRGLQLVQRVEPAAELGQSLGGGLGRRRRQGRVQ